MSSCGQRNRGAPSNNASTKVAAAPRKAGLVVVHEDAEVLQFDIGEDTQRQRLDSAAKKSEQSADVD